MLRSPITPRDPEADRHVPGIARCVAIALAALTVATGVQAGVFTQPGTAHTAQAVNRLEAQVAHLQQQVNRIEAAQGVAPNTSAAHNGKTGLDGAEAGAGLSPEQAYAIRQHIKHQFQSMGTVNGKHLAVVEDNLKVLDNKDYKALAEREYNLVTRAVKRAGSAINDDALVGPPKVDTIHAGRAQKTGKAKKTSGAKARLAQYRKEQAAQRAKETKDNNDDSYRARTSTTYRSSVSP